jgi:hypothetical protein
MKILVVGAVAMLATTLVLAWTATFAKLIAIPAVQDLVKDYHSLVRAHIDLMMMALFCFSFFNLRIPLSVGACVLTVIGGFSNPSLFLIRAFYPDAGKHLIVKAYRTLSFTITTVGFSWILVEVIRAFL